jgi:hypothetical protein
VDHSDILEKTLKTIIMSTMKVKNTKEIIIRSIIYTLVNIRIRAFLIYHEESQGQLSI